MNGAQATSQRAPRVAWRRVATEVVVALPAAAALGIVLALAVGALLPRGETALDGSLPMQWLESTWRSRTALFGTAAVSATATAWAWARSAGLPLAGPVVLPEPRTRVVLSAGLLGGAGVVTLGAAQLIVLGAAPLDPAWPPRPTVGVHGAVLTVVVILAAALGEELLFRACLLGRLSQVLHPLSALALSSLAFALLHPLRDFAVIACAGLLFGSLWLGFGSTWPAAAAHAGWNLGLLVPLGMPTDAVGRPFVLTLLAGVVTFGFCARGLWRMARAGLGSGALVSGRDGAQAHLPGAGE